MKKCLILLAVIMGLVPSAGALMEVSRTGNIKGWDIENIFTWLLRLQNNKEIAGFRQCEATEDTKRVFEYQISFATLEDKARFIEVAPTRSEKTDKVQIKGGGIDYDRLSSSKLFSDFPLYEFKFLKRGKISKSLQLLGNKGYPVSFTDSITQTIKLPKQGSKKETVDINMTLKLLSVGTRTTKGDPATYKVSSKFPEGSEIPYSEIKDEKLWKLFLENVPTSAYPKEAKKTA